MTRSQSTGSRAARLSVHSKSVDWSGWKITVGRAVDKYIQWKYLDHCGENKVVMMMG